ncbi:hypothetical protein [Alcanivorax sp. DP30]|uniref:tetratricopeptide repeat protein n=1 Tax=Alcanivorax sp. DP30 TaxID=2606217 RepID=UPI001F44CA34|nr:hypothetical protein [Alcanivorax sp. DP30]
MRGWVWVAVILAGCASQPSQTTPEGTVDTSDITCQEAVQPEQRVDLEMIDTLMGKGRNHAALARLESKPMDGIDYWLRYGQLLASTGKLDDAEQVFRELVLQCVDGRSRHGLGMVQLKRNHVNAALLHLEIARNLSPASAQVRNDYGYALLLAGRYQQAAFELRTALELANGQGPVRQNVAVAYLLRGDEQGLDALKSDYGFSEDELDYARALRQQFGKSEQ